MTGREEVEKMGEHVGSVTVDHKEAFSYVAVESYDEGVTAFHDVTFGDSYRKAYGHLDGVSVVHQDGTYRVEYVNGMVEYLAF